MGDDWEQSRKIKIGDEVQVKVIEIDNMGRVNLSRRAILQGDAYEPGTGMRSGPRSSPNRYDKGRSDSRGYPPRHDSGGDRGGPPGR